MKKLKLIPKLEKYYNPFPPKSEARQKMSPNYREACKIRKSIRWQKIRPMAMARFSGLCAYCFKTPAAHVHHIKRLVDHSELAFELSNLAPLCEKCHKRLHARESRGEDAESQLLEKMQINLKKTGI